MIGHLSGRLLEKEPTEIVVEAGGVGYRVSVPLTTFGRLPRVGDVVALSIHTHVREDAIALYGFDSRRERDLFERLIGVPGIGPRLALALLSHMDPGDLLAVARGRDAARLTRVPGIGPKTAERLIVELADVLERIPGFDASVGPAGPSGGRREDLISALTNLGYRPSQAAPAVEAALAGASEETQIESLLRDALRHLASPRRAGPAADHAVEPASEVVAQPLVRSRVRSPAGGRRRQP